jgi:hypothetical protein
MRHVYEKHPRDPDHYLLGDFSRYIPVEAVRPPHPPPPTCHSFLIRISGFQILKVRARPMLTIGDLCLCSFLSWSWLPGTIQTYIPLG